MSEITAITPQVKDKTRCNVFIDGRFCCGLTLEATVKNRLKVGQEISEAKLSEIQLESEKSVALDKALAHISATQKTEKQIREFLSKKGYLSAVADHVVEKMREYNFLNDGEYAESYVESAAKRKGSRLIRLELKSKGISDAEIDGALESLDEETEISTARGILDKYMRGKSFDRETLQKAYRYLMGKGFDYDVAKAALASLSVEEEE
ncbi:MAG: RecX family transcriptional regulator [Clostridia bacterium]|nr:RecX family transcriptional regulator [Clostridia bacterium]